MDPKELKKQYEEKKAARNAEIMALNAAAKREANEDAQKDLAGKIAIRDVVLPYLREIAAAIGPDFEVQPIMDQGNVIPIGAVFRFRNRLLQYWIEPSFYGNVTIKALNSRLLPGVGIKPVFILSSEQEPYIRTVQDLTREKLGRLVQIAMGE